jgi:membrane protease YdiL (CAAX protease family)
MTSESEPARAPYWVAVAAIALGLAGGLVATILVQGVGVGLGSSASHPTPAVTIVSDIVFDLAFVGAALYFCLLRGWMGRRDFGYAPVSWKLGLAAFGLAALAYYLVTLAYAAVFSVHGTDTLPSDLGVHRSTWAAIGATMFVCVVAPICEEFFFRGFLFGVLRRMNVRVAGRQIGPWLAALIVGVLFGLAHFDSADPQYLIPLGFLGFVLCLVRWKTGSLYPGMALHGLNNCLALGVNEFSWGAGRIVALCAGTLLVIALITGPISVGVSRSPA